ncbi:hypothetical protein [Leisingera thetidis]|uniref:hypothetical protein n=1 Tax=Leisingera thetidis TaxID=2930199 RepID=UPI0021F7F5AE|nr:hypothetical protein [Leisingera thetidis]
MARQEVIGITEATRRRYLTPITGQELTYDEKKHQAIAFLAADPEPSEPGEDFTFIFGEVGITADTPYEVAQVVVNMAHTYKTSLGPMIERLRLLAGKRISEAATVLEVEQALAEFAEDIGEI